MHLIEISMPPHLHPTLVFSLLLSFSRQHFVSCSSLFTFPVIYGLVFTLEVTLTLAGRERLSRLLPKLIKSS